MDELSDLTASSLRMSIELVKKDVANINNLFDKMDKGLSKITEQQELIANKTSSLVEQKERDTRAEMNEIYQKLDKTETALESKIACLEKSIMVELRDINNTLTNHIKDEDGIVLKVKSFIYGCSIISAIAFWLVNNPTVVDKILK